MNESKRKFFGAFSAVCAVPVAGLVAAAAGLREPIKKPAPIYDGQLMSAKDMNNRFDSLWKAIEERT